MINAFYNLVGVKNTNVMLQHKKECCVECTVEFLIGNDKILAGKHLCQIPFLFICFLAMPRTKVIKYCVVVVKLDFCVRRKLLFPS